MVEQQFSRQLTTIVMRDEMRRDERETSAEEEEQGKVRDRALSVPVPAQPRCTAIPWRHRLLRPPISNKVRAYSERLSSFNCDVAGTFLELALPKLNERRCPGARAHDMACAEPWRARAFQLSHIWHAIPRSVQVVRCARLVHVAWVPKSRSAQSQLCKTQIFRPNSRADDTNDRALFYL